MHLTCYYLEICRNNEKNIMKMTKRGHKNNDEIVKENVSEEGKDKKRNMKEIDRRICVKNIKKAKRIWKKMLQRKKNGIIRYLLFSHV